MDTPETTLYLGEDEVQDLLTEGHEVVFYIKDANSPTEERKIIVKSGIEE